MLPKEYLKSLTPGKDQDLIHEYEGGQINLRSYLSVDECEALPPKFFHATEVAQRCVLFGLLARYPNGVQMFPRQFGDEGEEDNKKVTQEYGSLNGLAINQIAIKVGLLGHISHKLRSFSYIEPETEAVDENEGE